MIYSYNNMDVLILSSYLLIPVAFLIGIIAGFFVGRKNVYNTRRFKKLFYKSKEAEPSNEKLKILHKANPKTFEQKRSEALEKEKPIIKTFYK